MCRCLVVLFLLAACEPLAAHPTLCIEDSQCPVNFFCVSPYCYKCLDCQELNRSPPLQQRTCLRTDTDCGPCYDGWIQSHSSSENCVLAATKSVLSSQNNFYVWVIGAGAVIGLLITIVFLHIFQNTTIFEIVQYYNPLSAATKWAGIGIAKTTVSSQASLKQKLQKEKSSEFLG